MCNFIRFSKRFYSLNTQINIRNVTIIGARLKGIGIAQVTAQAGQSVTLVDSNQKLLDKAQKSIQNGLIEFSKKNYEDESYKDKFIEDTMKRFSTCTKLEDGMHADLILEDVVDDLETKQDLFRKLDLLASPHVILAANPTSLSINSIGIGIKRKHRYGGLHFFNPVPAMRLIEVIKTEQTAENIFEAMKKWGKSIGKTCITCKDTPGFIVNRLLLPYGAEAMRMYERGDATKEDIDAGLKLGAGYPMGPFQLLDYTGLDTNRNALQIMYRRTLDPIFRPIHILDKLVEEGKLGIKTGEGFYKYTK